MNILQRELRAGRKALLFWMIGMFFCATPHHQVPELFHGQRMMEILDSLPRIVLALMGAAGADLGTLGGYTAMLYYYVLIASSFTPCIWAPPPSRGNPSTRIVRLPVHEACSRAHVRPECVSAYAIWRCSAR
jgi:hypothetical protein